MPRGGSSGARRLGSSLRRCIAWGGPAQTLSAVIASLAEEAELISCLAGEGAPLGPAEVEAMVNGDAELELRDGGQHAYWWLLAAE